MFETVVPLQFHSGTTSGRTRPCRITCQIQDGTRIELVAKFSAGCERKGTALAIEAISAWLAASLGLPVPQCYLVQIDPEWARAVPDLERQKMMLASGGWAFGSRFVGSQYRVWSGGDTVVKARLQDGLAVFAFDCFINNVDRHANNPNCLVKGDNFQVFDHELCFLYKGVLGWQQPWKIGALNAFATPGKHIFYDSLKGKQFNLKTVENSWAAITDERLQECVNALPAEWCTGTGVEDAIALIKDIRNNIGSAIEEVRRVLG